MSDWLELAPNVRIICADCRDVLPVACHAVVTDPPYGLAFMGKRWDYDVPRADLWRTVLASLPPGGHLLSFAGTRTQHRMAVNIEDAGFEIRDMIAWVYGSGFPKSLDVSKAIDKAAGAARVDLGAHPNWREGKRTNGQSMGAVPNEARVTAPATDAARCWAGYGTALKPALEPITLARKPMDGTVAANVLAHGTGALNIDGCRIGTTKDVPGAVKTGRPIMAASWLKKHGHGSGFGPREMDQSGMCPDVGRWPANLIHDGSDEVLALFPQTGVSSGGRASLVGMHRFRGQAKPVDNNAPAPGFGDTGSAARFFYCAKASRAEREGGADSNHHPTVKPVALMRYLCRLVTPPDGSVLDPFLGSGTTGIAAINEGFGFVGVERDPEYFKIARRRLEYALASAQPELALQNASVEAT